MKGAYFAILTQALAVAFATLLIATIKQTGGFNGLNTFTTFFGYNLYDPTSRRRCSTSIAAGLLIVCLLVVWQLYRSRFGELLVATRDAEERVRFLGYDPANIKLVAFVVAAVMASIGGAMFVPIAGIISPSDVDATASIMLIAGVALGGRAVVARPGARRDRGRLRPVDALGAVPEPVDLLPGRAVHRGHPAAPRRPRPRCSDEAARTVVAPDQRPARQGHRPEVAARPRRCTAEDYLEVRDLTVDFDGFKAIDGVDLTFAAGAAALPHRPERRRQDHPGRRPDRAGARPPASATYRNREPARP